MDFDDTPDEALFRTEARAWLEQHAPHKPADAAMYAGPPVAGSDAETEHVARAKAWQRTLYDHGWAGITWPKEHGGRGGTPMQQVILNQELGAFDAPLGVFAQGIGMAGPTLIAHGSAEQQERFLPPMLRGDEVWCQLFSEPAAGSDLAGLATKAERDGDEFVVNGQKVWTSSAHYADWGILLARTDPGAPKHRGITYFLVDMRSHGIDIRPLEQITGSAHFSEVFFTDLRIPAGNVVGDVNDGWRVAMTTLTSERTLIGGGAGAGVTADELVRQVRRAGRSGDPVARQAVATLYTQMQIQQYLGWRAQTAISQNQRPGPESSVLKLGYTRHLATINDFMIGLDGPSGTLLSDRDPATSARAQRFLGQWSSRIGGGTDEIQRNIIAERVLGLPGEIRADKNVAFRDLTR